MGWWGYESDANDNTYNALGVGLPHRFSGAEAISDDAPARSALEAAFAAVLEKTSEKVVSGSRDVEYDRAAFLGVSRLGLVKGLALPLVQLARAKAYAQILLDDEEHTQGFREPERRKQCLRDEIAMLEDALRHGGRTSLGSPSMSLVARMKEAGG